MARPGTERSTADLHHWPGGLYCPCLKALVEPVFFGFCTTDFVKVVINQQIGMNIRFFGSWA
jgi:hypothetical protein